MNKPIFSSLSGVQRRSVLLAGAALAAAPGLRAQTPAKVIRIGSPDLGTAGKPFPGGSVTAVLHANRWLEEEFAPDGIKVEWSFSGALARRCTRRCRPSSWTWWRWPIWPR